MPATAQFEAALQIIETLRAKGYEAYLAGGCVRDLLLGREPADYDVATSATPDVVLEMFPRTFAVGAHFGVVLVAPESRRAGDGGRRLCHGGGDVRSDGVFRRAASRCGALHQDRRRGCERRDFTINGLLLDVAKLPPRSRSFDSSVARTRSG